MLVRDFVERVKRKPMVMGGYESEPWFYSNDLYEFFRAEKQIQRPSGVKGVDLIWRGDHYFAYSYEISPIMPDGGIAVLISMVTRPLTKEELRDLRRLDPDRRTLVADMFLDLEGKSQVKLRKKGDTLTALTDEQEEILKEME